MTPFSIPPEIFDQLRRDLRDQSGIPSYVPTDPSVPNLQPYESCISQVDPSPPYLRCWHCKGRLLRGVNSVFCVFCGKERFGDAMPDPLNFRDSKGYGWLLEALGLDGSENVAPISVEDEPYQEKDRFKEEIHLSDLLSLEIKWSVPTEKPSISDGADSALPKSYLNLGGVDFDNFFGEGMSDIGSTKSEKKSGADEGNRASDRNITQASSDLSLFGNVPQPSATVNSTDYKNRNSMSAWEAEFQSADSETAQKASLSLDTFAGPPSVDMSAHMDAMFGSGNEQKRNDVKPSSSDMENWFDDDPRGNSNVGFNGQDLRPKPSHDAGHSGVTEGTSKSATDYTCIEDKQWLSNAAGASKSDRSDEDDAWNGFTSSTNAEKHADGVANSNPAYNSNVGFNRQDLRPKPSHDAGHSGVTEGTSKSATDYTWIEDNQWLSNAAGASKSDRSDEDDSWNDFTSPINAEKHPDGVANSNPAYNSNIGSYGQDLGPKPSHDAGHSGVTEGPSKSTADCAWIEDNQWLRGAAGARKSDRSDDEDAWNDFTSSTNALKHADCVATSNPTPSVDFFGSSNDLTVDFEFSRQDLFSGTSSIAMEPLDLSSVQTQASSLGRVLNLDTKETSEETVKPEGGINAISRESDQLQMLMSQMHDLSFMLDSNLSIPSMSGKISASEK